MAKNTKTLNKFLTGSVTAAMVATAIVPVASANNDTAAADQTFSDVPVSDTHYDNVMKALEYKFMSGYPDNTFQPYQDMPRSQVVKALAKYLIAESGMTEAEYTEAKNIKDVTPFNDVTSEHPDKELYNFSLIVKEAKIFTGSNNNLMPANKITRQQMAKVVVEAFDFKDLAGVESKVTDNDQADASLRSYIDILSENGLTTETTFNPRGTVKRAQMASFLVRSHEAVNPVVVAPEVVEVSAITKTSVTVVYPKVTVAKENVTIEVKNPSGALVEVKPVNLEIGDTEITFDFKTALSEVALGTWTVEGLAFDTNAQAAVAKVNAASNEVELLAALQSSFFKNVSADFITEYDALLDGTQLTVKEVQDLIDKANSEGSTAEQKAAAVKAVKDATNQVQLLEALKNSVFKRVNSSWIVEYQTAINAAAAADKDTVAEIQVLIDGVNTTGVNAAITEALDKVELAKISSARTLVTTYVETEAAQKPLLAQLSTHEAVVNVVVANTNAKLENALKALAALDNNFSVESMNSLELTNYRKAILDTVAASKNTATEIQTIVDGVNAVAETTAVTAVAGITATTALADVKSKLLALADRSSFASDAFDKDLVIDALLEEYRTDIVAALAADKDSAAEIAVIVEGVNDTDAALDAIDAATDSTTLLTALKAKNLNYSNIVDGNKEAYGADLVAFKAAADKASATSVASVKKLVSAVNAKVAVNNATSTSAARTALVDFAISTDDTGYINLSALGKLEVAELVVADIKANTTYATVGDLTTAIATQIAAHTTLLAGVNADTNDTIAEMNTALTALNYTPYKDLSASKKIEVAEAFLNAFPTVKDKDGNVSRVDYTSVTAIKADIDKAIAATK